MFKITTRQIKILSILFLGAMSFSAHAQDSNLGNWLIYIGNKKLNSKWNIHNEIQYRNYNAIGDLEQLLLRTGVGHNLTENNNNILLGYGYILSKNYIEDTEDKVLVNEHRVFQQYTTKQSIGKITSSHRYRFEQRFVEDDFKLRLRYFLSLNIPFKQSTDSKIPLYFSAYNEIFLNTKSSIFSGLPNDCIAVKAALILLPEKSTSSIKTTFLSSTNACCNSLPLSFSLL